MQRWRGRIGLSLALLALTTVSATNLYFTNHCSRQVSWIKQLETASEDPSTVHISASSTAQRTLAPGSHSAFRAGKKAIVTTTEFLVDADGRVWFDMSVITISSDSGFQVPTRITPRANQQSDQCVQLECLDSAACKQSTSLHGRNTQGMYSCPPSTDLDVVFCPSAESQPSATTSTSTSTSTDQSTTASTATYTFTSSPPSPSNTTTSSSTTSRKRSSLAGTNADGNADALEQSNLRGDNAASKSDGQIETGSSSETSLVVLVLAAVGFAAGVAVIVVVRRKRSQLEDLYAKSPTVMMSTTTSELALHPSLASVAL